MARTHLVRVGAFGHVGRFASLDAVLYPRAARVIVRTDRGLETGEVLARGEEVHRSRTDGAIVRGMTPEDDLLLARLEKHKQAAFDACQTRLRELDLPVVLMDVEHLFDGQTLYFYFLGEQPRELEPIVAELAEVYEAKAQIRRFAETLTAGCGPDCGTEAAAGSGCSACGVGCAVSGACSKKAI
jgi:cell fate regulator YaaT (PSP1 superfamily)